MKEIQQMLIIKFRQVYQNSWHFNPNGVVDFNIGCKPYEINSTSEFLALKGRHDLHLLSLCRPFRALRAQIKPFLILGLYPRLGYATPLGFKNINYFCQLDKLVYLYH